MSSVPRTSNGERKPLRRGRTIIHENQEKLARGEAISESFMNDTTLSENNSSWEQGPGRRRLTKDEVKKMVHDKQTRAVDEWKREGFDPNAELADFVPSEGEDSDVSSIISNKENEDAAHEVSTPFAQQRVSGQSEDSRTPVANPTANNKRGRYSTPKRPGVIQTSFTAIIPHDLSAIVEPTESRERRNLIGRDSHGSRASTGHSRNLSASSIVDVNSRKSIATVNLDVDLREVENNERNATFNINESSAKARVREEDRARRSTSNAKDVTMASVASESQAAEARPSPSVEVMEDVEMASVTNTPVRRPPRTSGERKRPSMEMASAVQSPVGTAIYNRAVKRIASTPARSSIGSERSSIQFDNSGNQSTVDDEAMNGTNGFVEAVTPTRTPRTTRLLRESIVAKAARESQKAESQGQRRTTETIAEERERRTSRSPSRVPLPPHIQKTVDRLSTPRKFVSPCMTSGRHEKTNASASTSSTRLADQSLISPAHKTASMHSQADTSKLLDERGAKSGLAMRIKTVPYSGRKPTLDIGLSAKEKAEVERSRKDNKSRRDTILLAPSEGQRQSHLTQPKRDRPRRPILPILDDSEGEEEEEKDDNHGTAAKKDTVDALAARTSSISLSDEAMMPPPAIPARHRNSSVSTVQDVTLDNNPSPRSRRVSTHSSRPSFAGGPDMMDLPGGPDTDTSAIAVGFDTPTRNVINRNPDLFSADTPGVGRSDYRSDDDEEEEEEKRRTIRRRLISSKDESMMEEDCQDMSQMDLLEASSADEITPEADGRATRILQPRKVQIAEPDNGDGRRRSTRNKMKPTRDWLGETAQYENSPGGKTRTLKGVSRVVITDRLFVQTGTADLAKAVELKKKTDLRRRKAKQLNKEYKLNALRAAHARGQDLDKTLDSIVTSDEDE